jgi:hypothetical protein
MGDVRAVTAFSPGGASLQDFHDEIVVKMDLEDSKGKWVLMARVDIINGDPDKQYATAKLIHDANVEIVSVRGYIDFIDDWCVYLQAGFLVDGNETVTLECNTYNGAAQFGSIIAIKVDDIDFQ